MPLHRFITAANDFDNLAPVDGWGELASLVGEAVPAGWRPPRLRFLYPDRRKGDFPSLASHIPIISSRALGVLGDLLEPSGQLFPLHDVEGEFFLMNVTRVVDVLDERTSEIDRFRDGRIMSIERAAFLPQADDEPIFRIPQTPEMDVFVNDRFRIRVLEAGLEGLRFS